MCFLRTACFGASGVGGGVARSGIDKEHVGVWTVSSGSSGIGTSGVVGGSSVGVSGVSESETTSRVAVGRSGDGVGIVGKGGNLPDFLF